MKILVRFPNWVGDCIMARGFLKVLKKEHPDSTFTILIKERLKDLVYDFPHIVFKTRTDLFNLRETISEMKFNRMYILPNSFSSAFFSFFYNIPERIGFDTQYRGIFLTHPINLPRNHRSEHMILNYIRLLNNDYSMDDAIPEFNPPHLSFSISSKRYVVLAPFAAYGPAKMWPFYKDIGELFKEKGYDVVIAGAEYRRNHLHLDENWKKKFIDKVGKTSLLEVAYLIKNSLLFIGNDSGLTHLSASLGVPTIVIFGSTSPQWTSPSGKRCFVFYLDLNCSPCFKRICPLKTYACLNQITPLTVFEKGIEFIQNK